jgi:hypothetical protein
MFALKRQSIHIERCKAREVDRHLDVTAWIRGDRGQFFRPAATDQGEDT